MSFVRGMLCYEKPFVLDELIRRTTYDVQVLYHLFGRGQIPRPVKNEAKKKKRGAWCGAWTTPGFDVPLDH